MTVTSKPQHKKLKAKAQIGNRYSSLNTQEARKNVGLKRREAQIHGLNTREARKDDGL